MKKLLPTILLVFTLSISLAFKVNDEVELEAFLNARVNPNFLTNKNIKATLQKGTTGTVIEVKNFNSGNSGIRINVTSGPLAGSKYWVYFNKKSPAIKIFNKKKIEVEPVDAPENADAKIIRDTTARLDPSEEALIHSVNASTTISNKIQPTLAAKTVDCVVAPRVVQEAENKPVLEQVRTPAQENSGITSEADEYVKPDKEEPTDFSGTLGCIGFENDGYNICNRNKKFEKFQLQNYGPNQIVTTNEYYINRTFEFEFPDRARSDMKLLVVDAPDDRTSHTTYSIMLFFPRAVLPSIKKVGKELHVTLPNKEIVKYDAATKQIIGGVLTEGKMAQDPNTKKALPANVKYTGSGVVIRADKSGDLPYGNIETRNGSSAPSTTTATVSKKGQKDCKIPSKDIWYNDKDDHVLIRPEYATDSGLDAFIKKKCGFSLY